MNPIQFGGYYKVQATWQNGQPLSQSEMEKTLPKINRYDEDVAFVLTDGSAFMGRNDAQGNDYQSYYQNKNLLSCKMPDYRHLDPGGIKDVLNTLGDIATFVARIIATPGYNKAQKAFEENIRTKAQANPVLKVVVTPGENDTYQFTKTLAS